MLTFVSYVVTVIVGQPIMNSKQALMTNRTTTTTDPAQLPISQLSMNGPKRHQTQEEQQQSVKPENAEQSKLSIVQRALQSKT